VQEALPTLNRKVRVETLPPYHTRLDVSAPAAMSYNLMEWLKETSPPFTAVHFMSPFLAHYATLARQQGLALTRTSLVTHFLYALPPTHPSATLTLPAPRGAGGVSQPARFGYCGEALD
jgi:hypothetical protein